MNESSRVRSEHLQGPASPCVRLCTLRQVRETQESTARQYGLKCRAQVLGWPVDRIRIIDEGLDCSG